MKFRDLLRMVREGQLLEIVISINGGDYVTTAYFENTAENRREMRKRYGNLTVSIIGTTFVKDNRYLRIHLM